MKPKIRRRKRIPKPNGVLYERNENAWGGDRLVSVPDIRPLGHD